MPREQTVETMPQGIEEVQLFLLAIPQGDHSEKEASLINFGLDKLNGTGLFNKVIGDWEVVTPKRWNTFSPTSRKHRQI